MVEVTDADREATKQHQQRFLTEGASEASLLWEAFARHRIAAYQRGKLEGARLALEAAALKAAGSLNTVDAHDRIRALDPAKIVGEG